MPVVEHLLPTEKRPQGATLPGIITILSSDIIFGSSVPFLGINKVLILQPIKKIMKNYHAKGRSALGGKSFSIFPNLFNFLIAVFTSIPDLHNQLL
ncbi:MAG: hypothetical protein V1833_03495 [Elusimicrobiota bacterium]